MSKDQLKKFCKMMILVFLVLVGLAAMVYYFPRLVFRLNAEGVIVVLVAYATFALMSMYWALGFYLRPQPRPRELTQSERQRMKENLDELCRNLLRGSNP
ncbi:MAG: hypothetical protein NT170_02475 [Candidatus Moranbacteria bacterium]|nr:hypothetical protein [Candidatus Moranbacteria bacterium]